MELDFLKMNQTMIQASEQKVFQKPSNNTEAATRSFGDYLRDSVRDVNNLQNKSKELGEQMAMGELENVHDLMIASEKASLAFKTMNAVRKKIIEAYKEVAQTRI